MRRAPLFLGATVAGLAGVLGFHTHSAPLTFATAAPPASSTAAARSPSSTGTSTAGAASPPSSGTSGTSTGGSPAATSPSATSPTTTSPTTTSPTMTHTVIGQAVNYNYGSLSVSVTVSGKRITKVGIASINDGGNYRSQSIDQQAIPLLEQQAIQAQSANIQGVGGASYTSTGFQQSLQSALTKLGL